jgi:F0F1-type ATP synthase membrane subunit a
MVRTLIKLGLYLAVLMGQGHALALTVFVFVLMMNAMDFLPLDLIPKTWEYFHSATGRDPHHAYMRVVPTADLNATLAMSIVVLFASIYYGIKVKGAGGFVLAQGAAFDGVGPAAQIALLDRSAPVASTGVGAVHGVAAVQNPFGPK